MNKWICQNEEDDNNQKTSNQTDKQTCTYAWMHHLEVLTLCGLCCMTASLPMLGPPLKQTTIFSSNTDHIRVNISSYISRDITITITIIKMTNYSKVIWLWMWVFTHLSKNSDGYFLLYIYLFVFIYIFIVILLYVQ